MAIYKNSLIEIAFQDRARAHETLNCRVAIDAQSITVSYQRKGSAVVFRGKNNNSGNFILDCPEIDGKASLHVVKEGEFLEGYWIDSGEKGYWRIKLHQ